MTERNLFEPRLNLKPYEYPELEEYKEAIQHSYWLHTEFNYTSDIDDFYTKVSEEERNVIKNAMLAIAQVEVTVKDFWGDLRHRMPKPELSSVGYTFAESECYIEGTEILTPKGWVDFRDVKNGDLVAQYNHDRTINFTPSFNKIKKHYIGELFGYDQNNLAGWVTPNHELIAYKKRDSEEFHKITASEYKNTGHELFLPISGELIGKIDNLSWEDKLRIAIQADGNYRTYRNNAGEIKDRGLASNTQEYEISFKKQEKKDYLLEILSHLPSVKVKEYNVSREGYVRYAINMDRDFNYKNFDWVDLSDKSSEWAKEFVFELAKWDGLILDKPNAKVNFSTTNKGVIDIAQAIGVAAGYRVSIVKHVDNRSETFNDIYSVNFVENRGVITANRGYMSTMDYEGFVYCLEVESGAIVTRWNDRTFIAGNCRHHDAYAHLLDLLGLNDEFEKVTEIPELINRIEYLEEHKKYSTTEDNRDYMVSLILFSLFIEHVSLFSQFLIIMSFNKHKNLFKGMSNAIEATSKEEQIHGLFGIDIVRTLREEKPDWFDTELEEIIITEAKKAMVAEEEVIDWIYEAGDLDFLPKQTVKEFVKNRLNNSLESIGYNKIFEIDQEIVEGTDWFDDEVIATKHTDFFNKRSVNYTKRTRSFSSDDLF